MKRVFLLVALTAVLAYPAFSEFRLDIGLDVPLTAGFISGEGVSTSSEVGTFLTEHIFPFPEVSLYYQWDLGPLHLAPGIRFFTFILQSVFWPNLLGEIQLGPVFIDAQLGGLLFVTFGMFNDASFGQVIIPDLSVWFGLGKKKMIRLGGGAIGIMVPEISTSQMLFAAYVGAKVSLNP